MDINKLVNITSRAWALKMLALLYRGVSARQAPLLAASRASRTSFLASLDHLIAMQLIERNPGHGHPLRPEYRLTTEGHKFARVAHEIVKTAEKSGDKSIMIRKTWTVPVLTIIHAPKRFTEIKSALPMMNDRALSQSLDLLHKNNWLHRKVDVDSRPPRPLYQAKNVGLEISRVINADILC